jgi:hypothetical protein
MLPGTVSRGGGSTKKLRMANGLIRSQRIFGALRAFHAHFIPTVCKHKSTLPAYGQHVKGPSIVAATECLEKSAAVPFRAMLIASAMLRPE